LRLPIQTIISEGSYRSVSRQTLLDALAGTGALSLARERAIEYAEAARASLNGFNHTPYADALAAIPAYIIQRDH
jgi:geranylgeranyl pyrophosphate synthase